MTGAATTYRGRGIWYVDGRVACPLAGVGTRGANAANRIVIEDDRTAVAIDRACITVSSRGAYPTEALVADLAFLADARTARGEHSPMLIHLEIFRTSDRIRLDLHRHPRTRDAIVDAELEPFTVVLELDGGAPRTLLDRDIALALIRRPSLKQRALEALVAIDDHLEGARQDLDRPGFAIADLALGVGIGPLSKKVVRARLISLRPIAALSGSRTAGELFQRGAWELELTALSAKHLAEPLKHDLVLFGIDRVPLLAPVRAHGLRQGQRLAFRFEGGTGEIVLDDVSAPLEGAPDVARAYLEFHMLGAVLAEYAERFARGLASRETVTLQRER